MLLNNSSSLHNAHRKAMPMATGTRARAIPGVTDPAPLLGGLQCGKYTVTGCTVTVVVDGNTGSKVPMVVVGEKVNHLVVLNHFVVWVNWICRSSMASAVTILRASVR